MKPTPKRPRGKPQAKIKRSTVDAIVLSLAMELVDDCTLLKMRAQQLVNALNYDAEQDK